jgi:hypothetical protein
MAVTKKEIQVGGTYKLLHGMAVSFMTLDRNVELRCLFKEAH